MRLLADESCDGSVIRAPRSAGHDVRAAAEVLRGALDTKIADEARRQGRILLTEDLDFGHLIFALGLPTSGVLLIRWPHKPRADLAISVLKAVERLGLRLEGAFVVVSPGSVRVRRAPR